MATSFLSVSLSLSDFLADGFNVKKQGMGNGLIFGLTFVPPILFVFFFPGAFLMGLNFAGICCFILMILLPALMAWRGREIYAVANKSEVLFQMGGGKLLLGSLIIFSLLMTVFGVISLF
jgi:tyrosine-specific transport protein